ARAAGLSEPDPGASLGLLLGTISARRLVRPGEIGQSTRTGALRTDSLGFPPRFMRRSMALMTQAPAEQLAEADRRGRSAGPRLSWASSQPFESRPATVRRQDRHPGRVPWSVASTRYVLTAVAVDTLIATTVAVVTLT